MYLPHSCKAQLGLLSAMPVKSSIRSPHTLNSVPAAQCAIAVPVFSGGFQTSAVKPPLKSLPQSLYRVLIRRRGFNSTNTLRHGIHGRLDQPKSGNHQSSYHVSQALVRCEAVQPPTHLTPEHGTVPTTLNMVTLTGFKKHYTGLKTRCIQCGFVDPLRLYNTA